MGFDTFVIQLVCLSCGFFLLRATVLPRGWVVLTGLILLVTGGTFLVAPALTAWVAGILWLVLFFLPLLGLGWVNRMVVQERYAQARRVAIAVSWLHPLDGLLEYPELLRGLDLGQQGKIDDAIQIFNHYQTTTTLIGRTATALLFRMNARWDQVLQWMAQLPTSQIYQDVALGKLYLRSLGETGDLNGLLHGVERFERELVSADTLSTNLVRMFALAFCGQVDQVWEMFNGPLAVYPENVRQFWLGTAELAAGQSAIARQRLQSLLDGATQPQSPGMVATDVAQKHAIVYRLSQSSADLRTLAESSRLILLRLRTEIYHEKQYSFRLTFRGGKAHATLVLIGLNVLVFAVQMGLGGARNPSVLYGMGALIPELVLAGEWWRILTANFLHLTGLHLMANMVGLYLFGRFVETNLGSKKFLVVYGLSGTGAMAMVAWLAVLGGTPDIVCVGASGAVMGLLGVMGAILLWGWRRNHVHFAGKQLRWILVLVGLQVISDLLNPEVSVVGHISGLVIGSVVGYVLVALRSPTKSPLEY